MRELRKDKTADAAVQIREPARKARSAPDAGAAPGTGKSTARTTRPALPANPRRTRSTTSRSAAPAVSGPATTPEAAARTTAPAAEVLLARLPVVLVRFAVREGELRFLHAGDGLEALLGLTPDALCAAPSRFAAAITGVGIAGLAEAILRAERERGDLRWTGSMQRADDGRFVVVELTAHAAAGRVWEGALIDVTARVEAEQALAAVREELRLASAQLERVREIERQAIAQELHDDVGSTLTALKFELARMKKPLAALPELAAQVQGADELVDAAFLACKRVVRDLQPAALAGGLPNALAWLARSFEERTRIPCTFEATPAGVVAQREAQLALFRICQEALNNVAKYARASLVEVRLDASNGWLELCIEDDGRGIAPADISKTDRYGLSGMRERAWSLGGGLDIASGPGAGTAITARVPHLWAGMRA